MNSKAIKAWYQIHKWASMICFIFALLLCLTGLPLIFSTEEGGASNTGIQQMTVLPGNALPVNLDRITTISSAMYPAQSIRSIRFSEDEAFVYVQMTSADNPQGLWITFDNNAKVLEDSGELGQRGQQGMPFMALMHLLHCNLFAGQSGEFLLGFMCLPLLAALVSGTVLYGPFMKTQAFGVVRTGSPRRVWQDWHKMLGIVALVWAAVASLTGALMVASTPLENLWQKSAYNQAQVISQNQPSSGTSISVQQAVERVKDAMPDQKVFMVQYPLEMLQSPSHYVIWSKGTTSFSSYLSTPVLIEATTGELTEAPWYLKALSIGRPLHLSNYSTLPLKILWTLLDIITIGMLVSGIYAWWLKHRICPDRPISQIEGQYSSAVAPLRQSPSQIWSIPMVFGALTLFGLIAPLLGSGIWQWLSALSLAVLPALIFWRCVVYQIARKRCR